MDQDEDRLGLLRDPPQRPVHGLLSGPMQLIGAALIVIGPKALVETKLRCEEGVVHPSGGGVSTLGENLREGHSICAQAAKGTAIKRSAPHSMLVGVGPREEAGEGGQGPA